MPSLKGVVLACRRRELLLEAERGPIRTVDGTANSVEALVRRKAALGLERAGLARTYLAPGLDNASAWRKRLVHVELTPLGKALVVVAKKRLLNGRQMRWAELEPKIAAALEAQAA